MIIPLPRADLFDRVEALDSGLERASALFPSQGSLSRSLPSLLMWQDSFACALASRGGSSLVIAHYGRYVYLPVPPSPFTRENMGLAFDYMKQVNGPGPGISRVEGLTGEEAQRAGAWGFPVRPLMTEFIYDRPRVAGLHGDPYRAKRAEVNRLLREEAVLLRPYRRSDLEACGKLFELWKGQRLPAWRGESGEKMVPSAQKAHFRALHQGVDWGLDAWVVLLGERLAAYAAGAALDQDHYGFLLEVTDLTVKGLSAYIFASLCRNLEPFPFVNTGDAEGLPGLAEAKEHWHPVRKLALFAADPG